MSAMHKTAYMLWLSKVNDALIAEGKRDLFSFKRAPLPIGKDGDVVDEPGDLMASEVYEIMRKHGIQPFAYTL